MAVPEPMAEDRTSAAARSASEIGGSLSPMQQAVPATTVSTHFKMIFLAVLLLTVALLVARISVGIMVAHPSDSLNDAMSHCDLLEDAGFGAILGLLGGKVA
jgi:hypothetical protein